MSSRTWIFKVWLDTPRKGRVRLYYVVMVFKTVKKMRAAIDGLALANNWDTCYGNKDTYGRCLEYTKPEATGEVGIIFLSRDSGSGIAAHEMFHAAWSYVVKKKKQINVSLRIEEKIANLLQSLVTQYWTEYHAFAESEEQSE